MRNLAVPIRAAIVVLAGCLMHALPTPSQTPAPPSPGSTIQYGAPRQVAVLKDSRIDESSGIAASILYQDAFWTHNDSGDSARLFLFNKSGETIATVSIKGASSVDWEDIASFRLGNEGYVLVADAGDNAGRRKNCVLYIIREPEINAHAAGSEGVALEVEPLWTLPFSYEDGPRDCEAVAVDATESAVYLVSKGLLECRVYSLPIPPQPSSKPGIAKRIAAIKMSLANGMDISPDGKRAIISTYGDVYEFSRNDGESWARTFSRAPRAIKAPVRSQGESICYGADGKTLYLSSEKKSQPLWEIPVSN